MLAAEKPSAPSAPTTSIVGSDVWVSWAYPNDKGSPITSYSV